MAYIPNTTKKGSGKPIGSRETSGKPSSGQQGFNPYNASGTVTGDHLSGWIWDSTGGAAGTQPGTTWTRNMRDGLVMNPPADPKARNDGLPGTTGGVAGNVTYGSPFSPDQYSMKGGRYGKPDRSGGAVNNDDLLFMNPPAMADNTGGGTHPFDWFANNDTPMGGSGNPYPSSGSTPSFPYGTPVENFDPNIHESRYNYTGPTGPNYPYHPIYNPTGYQTADAYVGGAGPWDMTGQGSMWNNPDAWAQGGGQGGGQGSDPMSTAVYNFQRYDPSQGGGASVWDLYGGGSGSANYGIGYGSSFGGVSAVNPQADMDYQGYVDQTYDALMNRLNPQFEQNRDAFDQAMVNRGIPIGSEAYNETLRQMMQGENDAMTQAGLQAMGFGADLQNQMFSQDATRSGLANALLQSMWGNQLGYAGLNENSRQFGDMLDFRYAGLDQANNQFYSGLNEQGRQFDNTMDFGYFNADRDDMRWLLDYERGVWNDQVNNERWSDQLAMGLTTPWMPGQNNVSPYVTGYGYGMGGWNNAVGNSQDWWANLLRAIEYAGGMGG